MHGEAVVVAAGSRRGSLYDLEWDTQRALVGDLPKKVRRKCAFKARYRVGDRVQDMSTLRCGYIEKAFTEDAQAELNKFYYAVEYDTGDFRLSAPQTELVLVARRREIYRMRRKRFEIEDDERRRKRSRK